MAVLPASVGFSWCPTPLAAAEMRAFLAHALTGACSRTAGHGSTRLIEWWKEKADKLLYSYALQ